ncbi:MAG: hypothetical protein J1F40_04540 [Prevotellaceae bacterium]|nr:hypothetical protein [Prevotellaceae bacterium]
MMKRRNILYIYTALFAMLSIAMASAQPVRRVRNGIIVVGRNDSVRAIEPFGGTHGNEKAYADAVNLYQREFPAARVYCMVIPNSAAYYCPETAAMWTRPQHPAIRSIYQHLSDPVKAIDVYSVLEQHTTEPIYLRTDHHWSPLGAYYAAQHFAQVADVPFLDFSQYESRVVRDFVGSMYRFSRDISVKQSPEEFVYYIPNGVEYTTVTTPYTLTADRKSVLRAGSAATCDFFHSYDDGSAAAYCTFMGGDTNTTSITTSVRNGRRLMILKDSYGNALPAYLLGSFEEIHVVDCRYFTLDIRTFVQQKGITDILFANNILHASMLKTPQSYEKYLGQQFVFRQPVKRRRR